MQCSFFVHSSDIICGTNSNIKPSTQITTLHTCLDDIRSHLSTNRINPASFGREYELIKARAGLFETNTSTEIFTICPNHRYLLGKGWKSSKLCMLRDPLQTCNAKRKKEKATVTVQQSRRLLERLGILIPVGAGICRQCRGSMVRAIYGESEINSATSENGATSEPEITQVKPRTDDPIVSNENPSCQQEAEDGVDVTSCSYSLRGKRTRPISTVLEAEESCQSDDNVSTQLSCAESQGSEWLPNSQDTDNTESSEKLEDIRNNLSLDAEKRKALDSFMLSCGLSPVKKQMKIDWAEASDRTKNDYVKKTKTILKEVVDVLAPGQGSYLLDAILKTTPESSDSKMLEILSTAYNLSTDWGTQRQILSLLANAYKFSDLTSSIPSLTKYRYSAARKHALTRGIGQQVAVSSYIREGLSDHQVKHFIDFVMSPCIMTDSPYLETRLKLSNGEVFQVPQIILNSVRSRVVEQYQSFCTESGFENVASNRSYMRVLEAIEPSVRKSMKGLDNYAADGAKAIDDLKKIATVLGKQLKGSEWEEEMIRSLSDGKQYLKLEYKMHVAVESEVADHCCTYALSSDGVECSHSHNTVCFSCQDLDRVIEEIKLAAEEVQYEDKDQMDDIQYTLSQSVKALDEWKKHLLRSVNQDRARSDILEHLTENETLLERDWAMKFLPMMYRESQSKWFGKRGLNWHITVGTYKKEGYIHSHTIVHVFDNANQDTATSNAILKDCLIRLKDENPHLMKAFIRSDNAGCFHSVEAIFSVPSLNRDSELKVAQVDFADPQGGKSICDRRAAHLKGVIRKYVNEGNNVTTANELLSAVVKSNIKNVEIVAASPPSGSCEKKSIKVKDITSLNNFQYHQDHILAFKQYQIGTGVKFPNKDFMYNSLPTIEVINSSSTGAFVKSAKPEDRLAQDRSTETPVNEQVILEDKENDEGEGSTLLYTCPEPNCLLTFQKYGNLHKHLDTGNHRIRKMPSSLSDKSKEEYVKQIHSKTSTLPQRGTRSTEANNTKLKRGWALKSKRTVRRFSEEQTLFLREMFLRGEATGHKCDPEEVSLTMRTVKKDGRRRFPVEEFLTATQIASYFSRLALEKRKAAHNLYAEEDLTAEDFENNITEIQHLAAKK